MLSKCLLSSNRHGVPNTSLGSQLQRLTTLTENKFVLISWPSPGAALCRSHTSCHQLSESRDQHLPLYFPFFAMRLILSLFFSLYWTNQVSTVVQFEWDVSSSQYSIHLIFDKVQQSYSKTRSSVATPLSWAQHALWLQLLGSEIPGSMGQSPTSSGHGWSDFPCPPNRLYGKVWEGGLYFKPLLAAFSAIENVCWYSFMKSTQHNAPKWQMSLCILLQTQTTPYTKKEMKCRRKESCPAHDWDISILQSLFFSIPSLPGHFLTLYRHFLPSVFYFRHRKKNIQANSMARVMLFSTARSASLLFLAGSF